MPITLEETLERVRENVKSRGGSGIAGLARAFRVVDSDGNKVLDREEFKTAMNVWKMQCNEAEINVLMGAWDEDGDGHVSYDEFLKGIKGEMNPRRTALVTKAFKVLDTDDSKTITLGEITDVYDASMHPEVKEGKKSEEEVFLDFLNSFEGPNGNRDGEVSLAEFIDYYTGISCSIDDDDYFALMMCRAWKIDESDLEYDIDADRLERLILMLKDKLINKKKGHETEAKALLKAFKYCNLANSNMVDLRTFEKTVERFGIVLEPQEMKGWFAHYDKTKSGSANYEAIVSEIYPDENINIRANLSDVTPPASPAQNKQTNNATDEWRPSTARVQSKREDTRLW